MKKYDPKKIEPKWQKYWLSKKTFAAQDKGSKEMVLVEFPYPSGAGLHMGHMRPFIAGDVVSKFWKLNGKNVMYPIGWDAFGLPAENYAIKNKVHPAVSTAQNIKNAKKQLLSWGTGFDWAREINTTDPNYYKWTQKLFLEFYNAGLAYEKFGEINWCPKDKTGLANEEVVDGKCERCGTPVEKKSLRQWYLKITDYAEKLLEGLKDLPEWPESVKIQQANWIGKSQGVNFSCEIKDLGIKVQMYNSVPQTYFAETFTVIAAEHALVPDLVKGTEYEKDVMEFVEKTKRRKSEKDYDIEKDLEGIFTGRYIKSFADTGKDLPIWIASYVVADYGTGIVNCSAHDMRDFAFAKKYSLSLHPVMFPSDPVEAEKVKNLEYCYAKDPNGIIVEPSIFKGRKWGEVRNDVINHIVKNNLGERKVNFKMRDWVFSRQRYWGEPIPLIHCDKCGIVPVPEKDLPVKLPNVKNYEPTGTGESPLAAVEKWVNTTCPTCGKKGAKRETNTMPQWAGSSWYWMRYMDVKNKKEFSNIEKQKYWSPVDLYFGGMEHTTLHLLYSRFWNLFLYDRGLVAVKEPYAKRVPHGIILGPDGEKMSKSRGNVVNPDELVGLYGADTVRLYMMFLGPHEAQIAWNDKGIVGARRFIERVWSVQDFISNKEAEEVTIALQKMIKKVSEDLENFAFNTAVSAMMIFVNVVYESKSITKNSYKSLVQLLSPFAPHVAEEIWGALGEKKSIYQSAWPTFDEKLLKSEKVKVAVQINGKTRSEIEVERDSADELVEAAAMADERVKTHLQNREVRKVIVVKNRIINIVIS